MNYLINHDSLRDAVIEYLTKIDSSQNHIMLRVCDDGTCYTVEDTSYCVSEAEFNRKPGCEKTVLHATGNGQCNLPDDWWETDDGIDSIDQVITRVLEDLENFDSAEL